MHGFGRRIELKTANLHISFHGHGRNPLSPSNSDGTAALLLPLLKVGTWWHLLVILKEGIS